MSVVFVRPDPAQHTASPGAQGSDTGPDVLLLLAVGQGPTLDPGHLGEAQVLLQPPLRADREETDV